MPVYFITPIVFVVSCLMVLGSMVYCSNLCSSYGAEFSSGWRVLFVV